MLSNTAFLLPRTAFPCGAAGGLLLAPEECLNTAFACGAADGGGGGGQGSYTELR